MMDQPLRSPNEISTGYLPRPLQFTLHKELKRFNVLVCHRRFGKTVFCINHLINQALTCNKPLPRMAYIAPTFGQAKRVAWDMLKEYSKNLPGVSYNEAELRMDLEHNKARIQLLSAENPVSLKGIYLDSVVLDEVAEMNPSVWRESVRPTLVDRDGSAIFIGTPRGFNHFQEFYSYASSGKDPDWYAAIFKASETGIIPQKELDALSREMSEEEYAQELEVSFSAGLVGAYFSKELAKAEKEGRITTVPHDSMITTDVYFDLGINDATSVWFVQNTRTAYHIIDHYEVTGLALPDIVKDVKARGYLLNEWVLPHDAAARDLSTGKTQEEMFYNLGVRKTRIVPRVGSKRDSINAARVVMGKCFFDKVKCAVGLKALANYQRKWDAKNNVFQDNPLHNFASNSADAFQTFAMGVEETRDTIRSNHDGYFDERMPMVAETEYDVYSYGHRGE